MKHLPTYTPYIEARQADAQALTALASAKKALYLARQASRKVARQYRHAWVGTVKVAENRVAQAKHRAEAAEATLIHAWGFHQASMADAKNRRVAAKQAHQAFRGRKAA